MTFKGNKFTKTVKSYTLFGSNLLASNDRIISRLSNENSTSQTSFLHDLMTLWMSNDVSKPDHLNAKQLGEYLNEAFHFFLSNDDFYHASELALRLLQDGKDDGEKLLNSFRRLISNPSSLDETLTVDMFHKKIMRTLLKLDHRVMYTEFECLLDQSSLSNDSYMNQVLHYEIIAQNWGDVKKHILRLTDGLNQVQATEKISSFTSKYMTRLMNQKAFDQFSVIDEIVTELGLANPNFKLQRWLLALDANQLDVAEDCLMQYGSLTSREVASETIGDFIGPYMRQIARNQESEKYINIENILSNYGFSNITFMYQAFAFSLRDGDLSIAKETLLRLCSCEDYEEYREKVSSLFRRHIRGLINDEKTQEHASIITYLKDNDLLLNDTLFQSINYYLKGKQFTQAKELINLLSDEVQPLRKIILLKHMLSYAKIEDDESKLKAIEPQLISAIFDAMPISQGDSFRHCEIIFNATLGDGEYKENKFLALAKAAGKDPLIAAFLNIIINAFNVDVEIPKDDYDFYFSNETDRKEAINTLFKSIYQVSNDEAQRAMVKLYQLAKNKNDFHRQLFLLHQIDASTTQLNIQNEINAIHPVAIEQSKIELVKPYLLKANKAQGNVKILLLTCIWRREALTKVVLKYYQDLAHTLSDKIDLTTLVVGSEGKPDYMDEFGHEYVHSENKPLSNKWQTGIQKAKELEHDAVVIVGSDDLISEKQFRLYCDALDEGHLFYGVADLGISNNSRSVYWPGYQPHFSARRYLESIGAARMIATPLLKALDYKLWDTRPINKGLDRLITDKLDELGLPRTTKAFCPTITVDDKSYYWGQVLYNYKDTGTFVTDFKVGGGNITAFESFIKNGNCQFWVTRESLIEQYGEYVILEIEKLNQALA